VLFTVVFGAPVAAAAGSAGVLALLGLGPAAPVLGFFLGAPAGLFGANWYFENRGKRRLAAALRLHSASPDRGKQELAAIAGSRAWLPEIRLEAAARLAIEAFENGEVSAAIQHLDLGEQDHHQHRRRRSWEAGLRGEVMRAILAWLSPDRFGEYGVARSETIREPEDDAEGAALLAALRVLEAAGRPDDGPLLAAWNDTRGSELRVLLPTLHTVVSAVTAERIPHLADALHQRLRDDQTGRLRALLRRLFPRMQLLVDDGYRGVSADPNLDAERAGLEIVAPEELTALARPDDASVAPLRGGSSTARIFGFVYASAMLMGALLTIVGAPLALGLVAGFFMALYVGTPIAAVWGGNANEARERGRRVAALRALHPPPPGPWLVECAAGPPGPVVRSSGYRKLAEIPVSQMVLYVACIRAEQALARGDVDEAWKLVEWWFAGIVGALPSPDPMYAVGSSLIRIATLTGHLGRAQELAQLVPEHDSPWDDTSRRTAYGNAPRALALARALLLAHRGQWDHSAGFVESAAMARPVYLPPSDQALYGALVRRLAKRGYSVRWTAWKVDPGWEAWVEKIWPDPAGQLGAGSGAPTAD
jgi:hypothetical protein